MRHSILALPLVLALSVPPAHGAAGASPTETRNVAILLYEGVELLDFAGPGEVFEAANAFVAGEETPAFRIFTVGRTTDPVTSQSFLEVVPDHSIADAPPADLLVVPGGAQGRDAGAGEPDPAPGPGGAPGELGRVT